MDFTQIGSIGGYVLGGGVAAIFAVKALYTKFVGDGITLTTTSSMGDMAELLSEQIKDLAETNKELRIEIKALRESNSQLIIQNLHLQEEVDKLAIKVQALSTQ
jgi:hypothetical protein